MKLKPITHIIINLVFVISMIALSGGVLLIPFNVGLYMVGIISFATFDMLMPFIIGVLCLAVPSAIVSGLFSHVLETDK